MKDVKKFIESLKADGYEDIEGAVAIVEDSERREKAFERSSGRGDYGIDHLKVKE